MAGRDEDRPDEDFLRVFIESDDFVFGNPELREKLGYKRNKTMTDRLSKLEERGLVGSKKVSGVWVWWITDEGREKMETQE